MSEQKTGSVRPTLKSLSDQIDELRDLVHSHADPPARDREAATLEMCVRAMDGMSRDDQRPGYLSLGYNSHSSRVPTAHERVLNYLRQRYGLPDPRAEVTRLRQELDAVTAERDQLRQRLQGVQGALATTAVPPIDMGFLS